MGTSVGRLSRELAVALRLPRTSAHIVDLLARSSRRLSVREIVSRVRMSERSVRANLALLVRRGVLEREIVVTAKKRVAYLYRVAAPQDLLAAAQAYFSENLRVVRGALGRGSSPRSASSGRS